MIHVQNRHLHEASPDLAETDWSMHLVMHWLGGEPLTPGEQTKIGNFIVGSADTGVVSLDLEADPYIPFAALSLDVKASNVNIDLDDDPMITTIARENIRKEWPLEKGIAASLGGLASTGIDLGRLELRSAHLVETAQLFRDREKLDKPLLIVEDQLYDVEEVAHSVFEDERQKYLDFDDFLSSL